MCTWCLTRADKEVLPRKKKSENSNGEFDRK